MILSANIRETSVSILFPLKLRSQTCVCDEHLTAIIKTMALAQGIDLSQIKLDLV